MGTACYTQSCVRALSTLAGLCPLGLAVWVYGVTLQPSLGAPPAQAKAPPARAKAPPTFTKDVAPILQQKCQNCHRRNQVGPFTLETYEQARKRASDIVKSACGVSREPIGSSPPLGDGCVFTHPR